MFFQALQCHPDGHQRSHSCVVFGAREFHPAWSLPGGKDSLRPQQREAQAAAPPPSAETGSPGHKHELTMFLSGNAEGAAWKIFIKGALAAWGSQRWRGGPPRPLCWAQPQRAMGRGRLGKLLTPGIRIRPP